jgi:hypothetical protein
MLWTDAQSLVGIASMANSKSKHRRKQMKIKQHWKARAKRKKAAKKAEKKK